jgi:ATP-dependent Zn protease
MTPAPDFLAASGNSPTPGPAPRALPPNTRRQTAFHEAGHIVCAVAMPAYSVEWATIEPSSIDHWTGKPFRKGHPGSLGYTQYCCDPKIPEEQRRLQRAVCFMGGHQAECLLTGNPKLNASGSFGDYERVINTCGPDLIGEAEKIANHCLRANWDRVERIAAALLKHGRISAEQIFEAGLRAVEGVTAS